MILTNELTGHCDIEVPTSARLARNEAVRSTYGGILDLIRSISLRWTHNEGGTTPMPCEVGLERKGTLHRAQHRVHRASRSYILRSRSQCQHNHLVPFAPSRLSTLQLEVASLPTKTPSPCHYVLESTMTVPTPKTAAVLVGALALSGSAAAQTFSADAAVATDNSGLSGNEPGVENLAAEELAGVEGRVVQLARQSITAVTTYSRTCDCVPSATVVCILTFLEEALLYRHCRRAACTRRSGPAAPSPETPNSS